MIQNLSEICNIVIRQRFFLSGKVDGIIIFDGTHLHACPFSCQNSHWDVFKYQTMFRFYLQFFCCLQIDIRLRFAFVDIAA